MYKEKVRIPRKHELDRRLAETKLLFEYPFVGDSSEIRERFKELMVFKSVVDRVLNKKRADLEVLADEEAKFRSKMEDADWEKEIIEIRKLRILRATVKIQAMVRGKQSRRSFKGVKKESPVVENEIYTRFMNENIFAALENDVRHSELRIL